MDRKEWVPRMSGLFAIIIFMTFHHSPDWIFKNDVMFVIFCSLCIIGGIASYILSEQIRKENEENGQ